MNHDEINNLFFKMLTDVKALIGAAVQEMPDEIGKGTALGGTSVALVECAYQLGMGKEELKQRLLGDIEFVYSNAGGLDPQQTQHSH
jgi:hypothetical protein